MLVLVKRGNQLEELELKKVLGSFGNCGTHGCDNCGDKGNDKSYEDSYNSWYSEIME
jgi:hypothetical protein